MAVVDSSIAIAGGQKLATSYDTVTNLHTLQLTTDVADNFVMFLGGQRLATVFDDTRKAHILSVSDVT